MIQRPGRTALLLSLPLAVWLVPYVMAFRSAAQDLHDVMILNGRVIDPESNLDAIRNVGEAGGRIRAITTEPLRGRQTLDAGRLVVAPGFIDLHQHWYDPEGYRFQVMDGVTTSLELERGTLDVDRW